MAITALDPRLLVEAHNDGDGDAFAQIVQAHHQGLFVHALSRLRDVEAAEDAVQETFVRAYRAMPRFQGDFHLRAWLHRILTNVCHDEGARRQRAGLLFEKASSQAEIGGEAADVDIERLDVSRDVVATALATLPVSYREALVLRYVDDLSYEEVAAATGVSAGNARVRVMRGRVALKRALTSSHAIVIGLLPWLRRGGRGPAAVADLQSLGAASVNATAPTLLASSSSLLATSPNLLASSPLLVRVADAGPQLAERMATLPQVLGLVATLAVPIAAPVVSDQVAGWVAGPPAATAGPADDVEVAAVDGGTAVGTEPAAPAPPPGATGPAAVGSVGTKPQSALLAGGTGVLSGAAGTDGSTPATASAPTTAAPVPTTSTSVPAPTSTSVPTSTTVPTSATVPSSSPTSMAPPATPPGRAAEKRAPALAPAPAPALPTTFGASLTGAQITSVGNKRIDLAGAVTWEVGADIRIAGDLSGTLVFDRPANAGGPTKGAADAATEGERARPPRTFSGELDLSLQDGRTYRLVLTDGTLDAAEAGTGVSATFELRDACDAVVAGGAVIGDLVLHEAPIPSSLTVSFDGSGAAAIAPCD